MAGIPIQPGGPDLRGKTIPEIWAPQLLVKFYLATVFGQIANTDFEGTIQNQGDTVHIRTTPSIRVTDYVKDQDIEFQGAEPDVVELVIEHAKVFGIRMDDVDKWQSDYNAFQDWLTAGATELQIAIDRDILHNIYSDAAAENAGQNAGKRSESYDLGTTGSPVSIDKTNVVDYIQDCKSVLAEQDVPDENCWIVMPEWMCNQIKKSDLQDASLSGDRVSIARSGHVGRIADFDMYRSNQLATTTSGGQMATEVIFGHKSSLTFASQLTKTKGPYEHPTKFATVGAGLQVYGYEVIKPEGMGHLHCYKG